MTLTVTSSGNKLVCVGNYRLTGRRLGKGNFAKVEEAVHTILNVKVAIKVMNVNEIKEDYVIQNLHREARLMSKLNHPCITALFETMQHDNMYYLVMELIGGGDLCNFIKNQRNGRLDETSTKNFGRQLTSALSHMHQLGIVHRDLKMENIMLSSSKTRVKIVDFGLSNQWSADRPLRTHCGSPEYAAPELFLAGKRYSPKVDLWSLGVILYGMVLGQLPFISCRDDNVTSQERRKRLLAQINRGLTVPHRRALIGFSADFKNLLTGLLAPDPDKRLSINDLVHNPWITGTGHKNICSNPLNALMNTTGMQNNIVKDISLLSKLDCGTVSRNIQTNPFGNLSGMYNILKYKKQSALINDDCVTKSLYSKTQSAKESRTTAKEAQAALQATPIQCTPRHITVLQSPASKPNQSPSLKLNPPTPSKSSSVKTIACGNAKRIISASTTPVTTTKSLQLRRLSTVQQQLPQKNSVMRKSAPLPKVLCKGTKEAKPEAGDADATRVQCIAQRTGYNLRNTLSRMRSPAVIETKSNNARVRSSGLEKGTKSEPITSRKNVATLQPSTPDRPAKRRSVLPVISTPSAPIRNVMSTLPTRMNLRPQALPAKNKSAAESVEEQTSKRISSAAVRHQYLNNSSSNPQQPLPARSCRTRSRVTRNDANDDETLQQKFHNEPIARSIVGYMTHAIPSKMTSLRWIKDLAKVTFHQEEIMEP